MRWSLGTAPVLSTPSRHLVRPLFLSWFLIGLVPWSFVGATRGEEVPSISESHNPANWQADPRLKDYQLTLENVRRVTAATKAMGEAVKMDIVFREEFLSEDHGNRSLEDVVNAIEIKRPHHVALMQREGLTTRNYFLTYIALLEADSVSRNEEEADEISAYVSPANLTFVREHRPDVQTAVNEINQLNLIREQLRSPGHRGTHLHVDSILVQKAARKLSLFSQGQVVRSYSVALGKNPRGPKTMRGDGRTPEGRYVIDRLVWRSRFYHALHISYPSPGDLAAARASGVSPGGDIEIHGLMRRWSWLGRFHRFWDWTDGCIALTNAEIDEIWEATPVGTPVEIKP